MVDGDSFTKPKTPRYMKLYFWRLGLSMALYAPILIGSINWQQSSNPPEGLLLWLVAAAPALCIAGAFWAIFKVVEDCDDEYQRMLFVKQILYASCITLSLITIWAFLARADLVPGSSYYPAMIWFVLFGISGGVIRLSERRKIS